MNVTLYNSEQEMVRFVGCKKSLSKHAVMFGELIDSSDLPSAGVLALCCLVLLLYMG